MKLYFLLLVFLIGSLRFSIAQSSGISTKNGKCYEHAYEPMFSDSDYIVEEYMVYTGNSDSSDYIESIEVISQKHETKWIRRMRRNSCLSNNPEDCLVWCMSDIPEEHLTIRIVIDTMLEKQFEIQKYIKDKLRVVVQVVCIEDRDEYFLKKLAEELIDLGYYDDEDSNSAALRSALFDYQLNNNLPIGCLDIKTMEKLGIFY